ncbi:hypothetical protein N1030_13490 [Desulfovibrio mangrovi]|uniref:hypothetical protein n=1 Tax=Desulfovibrio mangrovi TaxID=2976983 RepID=UPI0022483F29|nr:hypothetical protein [Desulfovibrio mangrovi]UZP66614.1 hypothetical protein N1030_13490 [Desulfovibrio mangrovi]
MAEKKALIVLAPAAELGAGSSIEKLLKKGAQFANFAAGDVIDAAVAPETVTALQPQDVAAAIEGGVALGLIDLGNADTAALDAALATIVDAADRKTVIAVVAKGALVLQGSGINTKAGAVARAACAKDIVPTLAYITDFPITTECCGAILYQALKSPNMKLDETTKLKEALIRMEGALARDNREPWDKHDCA